MGQPPEYERFVSISSGPTYVCGLRDDGWVVCWGHDKPTPPRDETLKSISVGSWALEVRQYMWIARKWLCFLLATFDTRRSGR